MTPSSSDTLQHRLHRATKLHLPPRLQPQSHILHSTTVSSQPHIPRLPRLPTTNTRCPSRALGFLQCMHSGPCVVLSRSSFPLLQPKPYVSNGAAQPIFLGEYKIGLTIAGIFGAFRVHNKHARPIATHSIVATFSSRHHRLPTIATNHRYRSFAHNE